MINNSDNLYDVLLVLLLANTLIVVVFTRNFYLLRIRCKRRQ